MRKLIMLASVAALAALPTAASAKPPHRGNGHAVHAERGEGPRARNRARPRTADTDRNRNGVADRLERRMVDRNRDGIDDRLERRIVDRNRDGIDDRLERRMVDRNRDGIDDRAQNRYGGGACPPGLANRTLACVPPGQARRMFREGQRIPTNYGAFTRYDDIPLEYREQFGIPSGFDYIYRDNSVYVVDPQTRLVRTIIDLIRR